MTARSLGWECFLTILAFVMRLTPLERDLLEAGVFSLQEWLRSRIDRSILARNQSEGKKHQSTLELLPNPTDELSSTPEAESHRK